MIIYGARDIFVGVAIYAAAYFGSNKALSWIIVAASELAYVDSLVYRFVARKGEWGY